MAENSESAEESDAPVPSSSSEELSSPKPDLWLVNDDPAQLLVQKRLLGRFAASVTDFSSPVDAVAAARAGGSSPFLVTDFNMPVMKGPQLASYWCALHPDARVLILSASEISGADRGLLDSLSDDCVKLLSSYRITELVKEAKQWFAAAEVGSVEQDAPVTKVDSSLDPTVLDKLQELGGVPFVSKVLTRFVSELPGRMETIVQSHEASDRDLLHRTAHSMKGSCGLIGAEKLAKVAGDLEQASAPQTEGDLGPYILSLKAEYTRTLEEVEARLGQ